MNVEMIGVENAKICDIFEDYEQLINEVNNFIQLNLDDFCSTKRIINKENNSYDYYYKTFKLDAYPNDFISVQIEGIYEKGIVIKITSHRDTGLYHDGINTSGLLILNENDNPKFIINRIDEIVNKTQNDSKPNKKEVELEINKLGKRIDEKYLGKQKFNFYYNVKRHQHKMNILKEKMKLITLKYIKKIEQQKKKIYKHIPNK